MPGFGAAHVPAGFAYDVAAYADFIEAARVELGIERVHLVLHDFGGPFGLTWGLQHADRWASVALMNIGVMPGYQLAFDGQTLAHAGARRAVRRRGSRARRGGGSMQSSNPRGLPPEFVDKMYDDYDRETRRTVLKLYRATPDPGNTAGELGGRARAHCTSPRSSSGARATRSSASSTPSASASSSTSRTSRSCPTAATGPSRTIPQRVEELLIPFLQRQLARAAVG